MTDAELLAQWADPDTGSVMPPKERAALLRVLARVEELEADLAAEVADNVSLREKHVTQAAADRIKELEAERGVLLGNWRAEEKRCVEALAERDRLQETLDLLEG